MKLQDLSEAKYYQQDSWQNKFRHRAEAERRSGSSIEIDYGLPSVDIRLSGGIEYYFQEHEAQQLLDSIPDEFSPEDFLLATAQGW